MMRRGAFLSAVTAATLVPRAGRAAAERFAPAAMTTDLRAFAAGLEEVGTEPFRTSGKDAFLRALARAEAVCSEPRTADEFYVVLSEVAASLNDGHVAVFGWKGRSAHAEAGGGEFPLRALVDDDGALVVQADLGDAATVPEGSVLTTIDGRPASRIVELALSLQGGQTPGLRRAFAHTLDAIFLLGGPHAAGAPYAVTYTDPAGASRSATVYAVSTKVRNERFQAKAGAADPYVDRGIRGGAAICAYNVCQDAPAFRRFLTAMAAKAKAAKARALIVDIRENGGGDSAVNDELFAFVTTAPYRQFGGVRFRVSDRLKREYGRAKYTSIYGEEGWRGKDGETLESQPGPPRPPRKEPNRFTGRSVLLTGTRTFSSAMACASAAKAYGLMTLVGQETGEPVHSTGEIYPLALPETGFGVFVTTKLFLPPKPLATNGGVVPDIAVVTTRADRARGRDPVLETALRIAAAHR